MNSREAFEARAKKLGWGHLTDLQRVPGDAPDGGYADLDLNRLWVGFQWGIQHASDVAVKVCEKNKRINLGVDYPEDAGYNLAIRVCVDAIKKKLHSRAATPGNKGTTPNS